MFSKKIKHSFYPCPTSFLTFLYHELNNLAAKMELKIKKMVLEN